jgi:TolA-binding protein
MRVLQLLLAALVVISCSSKPDAVDLITKAEDYYKDRKLVEALDSFQQYVQFYPKGEMAARSSFMIGFIYANDLKDSEKAQEAYQGFLDGYPEADPGLRASAEWELEHMGEEIGTMNFQKE